MQTRVVADIVATVRAEDGDGRDTVVPCRHCLKGAGLERRAMREGEGRERARQDLLGSVSRSVGRSNGLWLWMLLYGGGGGYASPGCD